MRIGIALAVLAGAALLGTYFIDAPPAAVAPQTPVVAASEAAPAARAAAEPETARAEAARRGKVLYYQYIDDRGSIRLVESMGEVPMTSWDRMQIIEIDASPVRLQTPRAPHVQRGPERRAFAYTPDPTVIVYSTSWCGFCRKTFAYLDAKGIRYQNRDIEKDDDYRQELIRKTGRTSIPVVEIDGTLVRGFNPHKMDRLLAAAG